MMSIKNHLILTLFYEFLTLWNHVTICQTTTPVQEASTDAGIFQNATLRDTINVTHEWDQLNATNSGKESRTPTEAETSIITNETSRLQSTDGLIPTSRSTAPNTESSDMHTVVRNRNQSIATNPDAAQTTAPVHLATNIASSVGSSHEDEATSPPNTVSLSDIIHTSPSTRHSVTSREIKLSTNSSHAGITVPSLPRNSSMNIVVTTASPVEEITTPVVTGQTNIKTSTETSPQPNTGLIEDNTTRTTTMQTNRAETNHTTPSFPKITPNSSTDMSLPPVTTTSAHRTMPTKENDSSSNEGQQNVSSVPSSLPLANQTNSFTPEAVPLTSVTNTVKSSKVNQTEHLDRGAFTVPFSLNEESSQTNSFSVDAYTLPPATRPEDTSPSGNGTTFRLPLPLLTGEDTASPQVNSTRSLTPNVTTSPFSSYRVTSSDSFNQTVFALSMSTDEKTSPANQSDPFISLTTDEDTAPQENQFRSSFTRDTSTLPSAASLPSENESDSSTRRIGFTSPNEEISSLPPTTKTAGSAKSDHISPTQMEALNTTIDKLSENSTSTTQWDETHTSSRYGGHSSSSSTPTSSISPKTSANQNSTVLLTTVSDEQTKYSTSSSTIMATESTTTKIQVTDRRQTQYPSSSTTITPKHSPTATSKDNTTLLPTEYPTTTRSNVDKESPTTLFKDGSTTTTESHVETTAEDTDEENTTNKIMPCPGFGQAIRWSRSQKKSETDAGSVSVIFDAPKLQLPKWMSEEECRFRFFVVQQIKKYNTDLAQLDEDFSMDNEFYKEIPEEQHAEQYDIWWTLSAKDVIYVSPTPYCIHNKLIITFFVRTNKTGNYTILGGNVLVKILDRSRTELEQTMGFQLENIFLGCFDVSSFTNKSQSWSFDRSSALIIAVGVSVGVLSFVIMIAALFACFRTTKGNEYLNDTFKLKKDVNTSSVATVEIGDLNLESEILKEENRKGNNGAYPIHLDADQTEGWIVPLGDVPQEEKSPLDMQDTRL